MKQCELEVTRKFMRDAARLRQLHKGYDKHNWSGPVWVFKWCGSVHHLFTCTCLAQFRVKDLDDQEVDEMGVWHEFGIEAESREEFVKYILANMPKYMVKPFRAFLRREEPDALKKADKTSLHDAEKFSREWCMNNPKGK